MTTAPLIYVWSGTAMEPLPRFAKICDREFVIGQTYSLDVVEERSAKSHNHEFAWLHEAWMNLPEGLAELYATSEHLRKRALIDSGFYDETLIDAGSGAAALRVASLLRGDDEFCLVIVRGPIVCRRKAKSQSRRAMGNADFQPSKRAIMEVVASMIGVTPDALQQSRAA